AEPAKALDHICISSLSEPKVQSIETLDTWLPVDICQSLSAAL
ncbi:hypothetical protein ADUPG1_005721, partial [Aduncisulcus paluster]